MKEDDRRRIEEKIRVEIRDLEAGIRNLEETVRPIPPDDAIGRLTRMEAISAKEVSEANLRSARLRLSRLVGALGRIDDPGFGACVGCEEPIPLARLLLLPDATCCVACAEARE